MAKNSSSSKKVAAAARAGGGKVGEQRDLPFPLIVGVIVVLGLLLVGWARSTRTTEPSPTLQDYWRNAYGVYDCERGDFLPVFDSDFDENGIRSRQDGLVHIHPYDASVTGKNAQLHVFLDNMGAEITDDELFLPGDSESLEAGVDCDGAPAILQVVRWDNPIAPGEAPSEVRTEDLGGFRFLDDAQAFTIALAPAGADVPIPPSVAELAGVTPDRDDGGLTGPNTTHVPGPQDFGTDTEPAADDAEADTEPAADDAEAEPEGDDSETDDGE